MKREKSRSSFHHRVVGATLSATLVAGCSLLATAPAAAAADVPQPALLYSFDGSSQSSTIANSGTAGSSLDGRIKNAASLQRGTGATPATGASGMFPGAPRDPSSTAPYVEIPDGVFDGADALTVSTWIKWDGKYADQLPWAYIVGSDGLPANNWGAYFVPDEGGQAKAVANSGSEVKAAGSALTANVWTYITTVVESTKVSYYANGVLVHSEPGNFDVSRMTAGGSTYSGLIGRVQWSGEWAAYFPGQFDDFSVYRQALTAGQVAALFATYTGSITSVGQTSFDVTTPQGVSPQLPSTVSVTYSSGTSVDLPISWAPVPASAYATANSTFQVAGTLAGWSGQLTTRVRVLSRDTESIAVDFGQDTGAFRGGASGTLYGLGDEQSPTQALVNGAAMTNISQKPPFGTQHPGGDVFNIEKTFFDKWGKDLCVYAQDFYPDWAYHGNVRPGDDLTYQRKADGSLSSTSTPGGDGVWDYLQQLEIVVDEVATTSQDPTKYTFIPFNEPDWIWYGGDKYDKYLIQGGQPDSFTPGNVSDWQAAYKVITDTYARHGLARPKIAGPGDAGYRGVANMTTFLTAAKRSATVPDVYVWHELGGYVWLPDRMVEYRQAARAAGIAESAIPSVNITEWGASTDMSSPANLLHWFASFEAAKVDAQTAYWTASGTMSDNQAKVNSANGGWWLFNWYGDLNGSRTVKVTEGQDRAIAAIDATNKRAQVIYGGVALGKDAKVGLKGLDPAVFGSAVDIEVRETRVSGTDGESPTPRIVAAADGVATAGASIVIPSSDEYSAYQVIVTPSTPRDVTAEMTAQSAQYTIEAEDATLTSAAARTSRDNGYKASAGRDVASFDKVGSKADWTVDVAQAGLYRFQAIGATPGVPVENALFVDNASPQIVRFGANAMKPGQVRSVARGSAEVSVQLSAGRHTLSLRTSADGTTLLPNAGYSQDGFSGVSLDRFILDRLGDTTNTERRDYPASTLRLAQGGSLQWSGSHPGWAALNNGARADLYPAALESGYYDVAPQWSGTAGATLRVVINGREAATFTATGDTQNSRVRVHLPEGISEIELYGSDSVQVGRVSTTRAVDGDAAIVRVEAEDGSKVTLAGTAVRQSFGTSATDGIATDGSGSGYVTGLGITDRNPANEGTMTVARAAGFDKAGQYDAIVHYSNDDIEGTHSYNPQVVDLGLQAKEGASNALVGRSTFRYTYLRSNFWEAVLPLTLGSADQPVHFGNTRETLWIDEGPTGSASDDVAVPGYAIAPNVDWIEFAPFVLESDGQGAVSISATLSSDSAANASGWYRSPVSVALTSSAADASVEYRLGDTGPWVAAAGPVVVSADGVTSVNYRAVRAGAPIVGSQGSVEIKLDRSAPTTVVSVDPASGSATVGQTVTARFSATDVGSGVAFTEFSTDGGSTWNRAPETGVSVTDLGAHIVQYRSVDLAGNVETPQSVTLTVTAANNGAAVSITSTDQASAGGWYRQPVLVKLTAPAAGQKIQYRINGGSWKPYFGSMTIRTNGVTKIDHRLLASNVVVAGSEVQTLVKVDMQAPTITGARSPQSGTGTPRNPIAVSFSAADKLSGLAGIEYRVNAGQWTKAPSEPVVFGTPGDFVVSYRSIDEAGNPSITRAMTLTVKPDVATSVRADRTAQAGGNITVSVAGFARWDDVTVTLAGTPIGTVLTDQNGTARVTLRVPEATAAGAASIVATGVAPAVTATTQVVVRR